MARGPVVPQESIDQIKARWAENTKQSATQVWEWFKPGTRPGYKLSRKVPSLRTVQVIIAEARKNAHTVPPDELLRPWGETWPKGADEIDILFRLMDVNAAVLGGEPLLTDREAKWALRLHKIFTALRVDDSGEASVLLLLFADAYANRERAQEVLRQGTMYTEDLDALMRYRPWESSARREDYETGVEAGLIPGYSGVEDMDALDIETPGFYERFWAICGAMLRSVNETISASDAGQVDPGVADAGQVDPELPGFREMYHEVYGRSPSRLRKNSTPKSI